MNYNGSPVLSRSTITSARALLFASLAMIFVIGFEIDTADLELLNIKIGEKIDKIAFASLSVLVISHLVNFWFDFSQLSIWPMAQKTKRTPGGFDGPNAGASKTILEQMEGRLGECLSEGADTLDIDALENHPKLQCNYQALKDFQSSRAAFIRKTRLYLFGWVLFPPMVSACIAFWLWFNA